jgi:hypothetical protein
MHGARGNIFGDEVFVNIFLVENFSRALIKKAPS